VSDIVFVIKVVRVVAMLDPLKIDVLTIVLAIESTALSLPSELFGYD
jgi:hypothetical protein